MQTIRTLIIEADPLKRAGLVSLFSREPSVHVIGAGGDVLQALESISPTPIRPDVVIIDIDNPELATSRHWALLRCMLSNIPIMVLTSGNDDQLLEIALGSGAITIYRQETEMHELYQGLHNAVQGTTDIDPLFVNRIKKLLMSPAPKAKDHSGIPGHIVGMSESTVLKCIDSLTPREKEVLGLLKEGKSNHQIAMLLDVTPRTVEFHVSNLIKKLGISSRVEAAILAIWLDLKYSPS
jgi:two-component system nitrate/nitrite response regulator NarL